MSMTGYTAPAESLINITDSLSSHLHICMLRTVLSIGVIFYLTWLVGTSRHKACAPVRSQSTHPSKLITPVHRMPLISNQLKINSLFITWVVVRYVHHSCNRANNLDRQVAKPHFNRVFYIFLFVNQPHIIYGNWCEESQSAADRGGDGVNKADV